MEKYTQKEWLEEGKRLFGDDRKDWKFVCVNCGTPQSARDFVEKGKDRDKMIKLVNSGVVGFSCIGRYIDGVGCDWSLGGFLTIHKVEVQTDEGELVPAFEFYKK
jgi:hypothetical protein